MSADQLQLDRAGDALAQRWGVSSALQRMTLADFRPFKKHTLRGFAVIKMPGGLTISDIPIHSSHGKCWASLPSKPVLDPEGRHVERAGKKQYVSMLSWTDRATADRWSAEVVALVREHHPEAFDGEALL